LIKNGLRKAKSVLCPCHQSEPSKAAKQEGDRNNCAQEVDQEGRQEGATKESGQEDREESTNHGKEATKKNDAAP
jgi:hypothetical protein